MCCLEIDREREKLKRNEMKIRNVQHKTEILVYAKSMEHTQPDTFFYALRFMFSFGPHDVFFYHAQNEYVYGILVNNEHLIAKLHDAWLRA